MPRRCPFFYDRYPCACGVAPDSLQAQALARHRFELFRSFAGNNPAAQAKVRQARNDEPGLRSGGMVDDAMRDYMRAAMAALRPK